MRFDADSRDSTRRWALGVLAGALLLPGASALAQESETLQLGGGACQDPPWLHCPDENCPGDRVINPGPVVEMQTRRTYFLDYPCDLQQGEDVTLILSLHGGGSYANWQRHYFSALDFVDEYRLVIATPSSPVRAWGEADDAYLRNIVDSLVDQIGKENIKSFWLAGHSQGGATSNRLLRTDYFKDRVDGWLSLSGGRLGGNPGRAAGAGRPRAGNTPAVGAGDSSAAEPTEEQRAAAEARRERIAQYRARMAQLPEADFSFIYAIGEREIAESGVPAESTWAEKYECGARSEPREIVDAKAGYVYDGTRQNPPNPSWGLTPAPGTATLSAYPDCADGRIVADIVRLEKGLTEGLEPAITEEIVKLITSAPGGKIQGL